MGAQTFMTRAKGATPRAAFDTAVEQAQYDYGHAGYTGTIAEKSDFTFIQLPDGLDPENFAERLIVDGDPRIEDKWGPAGCIKIAEGEYLFFGWASS